MDDLVISQMQFTGPVFTRPNFNKNIPASGERENSDIIKREIAQCATQCSCFHPGAEQRLHGGTEFHQLKWFFQKLQRAIRPALCHEIGRGIGNECENPRFRQDALHFTEKCDCARKRRIEIEDDEFRFVFERKAPRFRQ